MNHEEFRQQAHRLVDWMADYLGGIEQYPVKAQVAPGYLLGQLPSLPPETPEDFDGIFKDFEQLIMPGITHWQHPGFHAYFPANSSPPSVLAEMLTATLGAQCMIWQTSPAAAELEERMMQWLAALCGLPAHWHGVIQDTASTATLCALLTARERATGYTVNDQGLAAPAWQAAKGWAVYCSSETHSSIEKGVKIAGLGRQWLRKIAVDENFAMRPDSLAEALAADVAEGIRPLCVVASLGTTSSTAIDPLRPIGELCQQYGVWLHVDAAYAGTAALLPECRHHFEGLALADSYVFNPHKWMLTNFDCTAYYVRDREALLRTFEIMPEYLKTAEDRLVNNYRDWGIQLGRRFRALKLWFVLRSYGAEAIRAMLREHLALARYFEQQLRTDGRFEIMAPVNLNLVCFRYAPRPSATPNETNAQLLERLNQSGRVFLTHTKLNGQYTLRAVFGQTNVAQKHVDELLALLRNAVQSLESA